MATTTLTPFERREQHNVARKTIAPGSAFGLKWNVYDLGGTPKEPSEDSMNCTKHFANVVFSKKEYSVLFIDIYDQLVKKIRLFYTPNQVHISIKGSSALAFYFMGHEDMQYEFPFSDIDIVIFINPLTTDFEYTHRQITILAGQVFSKHKQNIDRLFFKKQSSNIKIDTNQFAQDIENQFQKDNLISPFSSTEIRNEVSCHSYSILHSLAAHDKIVKINEAHFDYCERIPLHKTPIVCSVNKTISNITSDGRTINFNLVRMKMGAIGSARGLVLFDCVDCIIPNINDDELTDFIEKMGFEDQTTITVNRFGYKITIQNLHECYENLWNMVNVYNCPNNKKESRLNKLDILEEYINQR